MEVLAEVVIMVAEAQLVLVVVVALVTLLSPSSVLQGLMSAMDTPQ